MSNRAASDKGILVDEVIRLSSPARARVERYRASLEKLGASELEQLATHLQAAASDMPKPAFSAQREEQRSAAFAEQEAALVRIENISDRISQKEASQSKTGLWITVKKAAAEQFEEGSSILPSVRIWNRLQERLRHERLDDFEDVVFARAVEALQLVGAKPIDDPEGVRDAMSTAAMDAYLRYMAEKVGRDSLRISKLRILSQRFQTGASQRIFHNTLQTSAFEPIFLTDVRPVLTPPRAADGLAKLYCFGADFRATRIVGLGAGGDEIAGYLHKELKLPVSRMHFYPRFRRVEMEQLPPTFQEAERILIVTGIASHPSDLAWARALLGRASGTESVAIVALAGRAELQAKLAADGDTYFPHLSGEHNALLPWQVGGYYRSRTNHVFGYETASPLRIAREFMEAATSSLMSLLGLAVR